MDLHSISAHVRTETSVGVPSHHPVRALWPLIPIFHLHLPPRPHLTLLHSLPTTTSRYPPRTVSTMVGYFGFQHTYTLNSRLASFATS